MRLPFSIAPVLIILLTSGAPLVRASRASDNTLANAQDLYAQASYEQALAVLDRLNPKEASTPAEGQAIRRYRALCLLALGRSSDAEGAVEEMVRADPAEAPSTDDLPPRFQVLVQQVRERVARELVRQGYERGRDLYGREQFAAAAEEWTRVIALLDDRTLGLMNDPGFTDLRLLADGFVKLAAARRAPEPAGTAGTAAEAKPVIGSDASVRADVGLVPPQPITQELPTFPQSASALLSRKEGELEIEVGADGRVTNAKVIVSMHPVYDVMLTAAAKTWRYQPARRNGEPVPYTKRVRVRLPGK
jgi:TonB family protein